MLFETPKPQALNPILKWAGGKRWLLPALKEMVSPYEDFELIEPFMGGLSVSLGLLPKQAQLNDINPHLVNFYKQVSMGLTIELELRNDKSQYYQFRERFNELIVRGEQDTAEAASLFYYLNRTCFNGLCRFNSKGLFNVPFGRYKSIGYLHSFETYASVFSRWRFSCLDFVEFLSTLRTDTALIYADPPYDVQFTKYYSEGFSWEQHVALAELLSSLPNPVIASNQATSRIVELYTKLGFMLRYVEAPRMISCNGDRKPALEVVAIKGLDESLLLFDPIKPSKS